jgi:hypothetical protein
MPLLCIAAVALLVSGALLCWRYRRTTRYVGAGLMALGIICGLLSSVVVVDQGTKMVTAQFGSPVSVLDPGVSVKAPWMTTEEVEVTSLYFVGNGTQFWPDIVYGTIEWQPTGNKEQAKSAELQYQLIPRKAQEYFKQVAQQWVDHGGPLNQDDVQNKLRQHLQQVLADHGITVVAVNFDKGSLFAYMTWRARFERK